jgi:hypothetical protein
MFKAHTFGDLSGGNSKNGLEPLLAIDRGRTAIPYI